MTITDNGTRDVNFFMKIDHKYVQIL